MPDRITAFQADVEWRANTNKAEVDVERLRRQFHEATRDMSTEALRAASAQERLDRALAKHGPSSDAARRAEVNLRQETERATAAANRHATAAARDERQIERLGRGALLGSGHMRGLARSVAFASTSFLGGYGLTYALTSSLNAFRESEAVLGRAQVAVRRAGLEYSAYRNEINATIQAQSRLSAFDDEQLLETFGRLVTRTKDVSEALKLNALAADVARGRNIDLEAAAQIVIKASIGQIGQLRRLGIEIDKNATATEALGALQERYAGQAAKFAATSAGAEARRNKALQDAQEIIGRGLAPAIDSLNLRFADWIENTENQRRLQRDVNAAVRTGSQVAGALADGVRGISSALGPVVDALGGTEDAAKAVIEAFALYKLTKIALGLRGIGTAASFTRRELLLLEAAGVKVSGGAGAGAGGRGAGGLGAIAAITGAPFIYAIVRQAYREAFGADYQGLSPDQTLTPEQAQARANRRARSLRDAGNSNRAIRAQLLREGYSEQEADIAVAAITVTGEDVRARGVASQAAAARRRERGGAGGGLSLPGQLARAELALAKARAADNIQAERAALVEEKRVLLAEIASKKAKFRDKTALYNQLAQVEDAIDAIDDARRAREEARAKAREDRAKRARDRRKERARREARELVEEMRYIKDIDRERSLLIQQNIASYGASRAAAKAGVAGPGNLFAEARDEFATYGSNIAGRHGVLSGQDARALQALLTLVELAREGNQHTRATAKAVHVTAKSTPQEITIARALAHQGL